MGLVQRREDGMKTPWQGEEPVLKLELLFPFSTSVSPPHTCFPSCRLSSQQRWGSRICFCISRGGTEVARYKLDGGSKALERMLWGRCGDSVHQVAATSLMTRTEVCTRQSLPAGSPREKRA